MSYTLGMNRHVTDVASHFEHVVPVYTNNRTTDLAPIEYIGAQLSLSPLLRGIDFGCGSGRYALVKQIDLCALFAGRISSGPDYLPRARREDLYRS